MITSNDNTQKSVTRKPIKRDQELYNPCFKEHKLSLKCLEMNEYNYDKCEQYFENYRICKKFWGKVVDFRKRENIQPYIPLPEDREKVKTEFMKSHKVS